MPRIVRKPAKKNFRRKRPGPKKAAGLPNDAELAAEEALAAPWPEEGDLLANVMAGS